MKQINFSHEGGFPLEQETLERLQAAYRSELFGALKAHLSIDNYQNYIVAHATNSTKGWAIIQEDETQLQDSGRVLPITEGILYPVDKGENTGYLKTTRTGTNLVYGTGVSQIAYYDYEAAYISESEFVSGVSQDSDALKISYHDLGNFKIVKDLNAIEEILQAIEVNIDAIETNINQIEAKITQIESDIEVINQTYLPLDGSKAMKGDLDLDVYQLSKLDIKESAVANVRTADFRLGSAARRGLKNRAEPLGRALVDSSDALVTNLHLNYESDWDTTYIGGKVHLNNLNTTNSTGSLLVIDGSNQVTKSNSLPDLLDRITVLESKIKTAAGIPLGMIALWGKTDPFPDGWEEYVPLRGRMPIGLDINDSLFNSLLGFGGSKDKKLTLNEIPSHTHTETRLKSGSGNVVNFEAVGDDGHLGYDSVASGAAGGGQQFSILNPYRVVQFIEYTGRLGNTAPTNLQASNISTTSLTLTWTAATSNVGISNYLLYKDGILVDTLGANVLVYPITGLSPGTAYTFSVVARDATQNLSTAVALNTATIIDRMAPTTPTGLTCYPTSENHITIQWNPSTDNVGVVRYLVFRRVDGETSVVYVGTPDNFCTVLGTPGITYFFKVKALDAAGNESPFTTEVQGAADPGAGDPGDEDPGHSCFDVESLVTMASGQSKKLKNIIVGDKLHGFSFPNEIDESAGDYMLWNGKLNEATKTEVTVVNKTTSIQPNYYEIKTADTIIRATEQHPLLVTEDGENVKWVCIKNVTESMFLIDKTGKTKAIESIQFKEEPIEVALLDVETVDNYVISGIVAHNNKPLDPRDPQP